MSSCIKCLGVICNLSHIDYSVRAESRAARVGDISNNRLNSQVVLQNKVELVIHKSHRVLLEEYNVSKEEAGYLEREEFEDG